MIKMMIHVKGHAANAAFNPSCAAIRAKIATVSAALASA